MARMAYVFRSPGCEYVYYCRLHARPKQNLPKWKGTYLFRCSADVITDCVQGKHKNQAKLETKTALQCKAITQQQQTNQFRFKIREVKWSGDRISAPCVRCANLHTIKINWFLFYRIVYFQCLGSMNLITASVLSR